MDRVGSLTTSEEELYSQHLSSCPRCAEEAHVEAMLREVIAPTVVPPISARFEGELMLKLGLNAHPAVQLQPSRIWGWIAGIVMPMLVLIPLYGSFGYILKTATLLFRAGMTILEHSDYFVTSLIESLPSLPAISSLLPDPYASMMMPLLLVSVVLFSGAWGLGLVMKR